ncbi:hypothetical protein BF49_0865 [Bradyrhizobium sp.]|nr:hypothetical protein BF49_0865 [Bradyrhizobium sp.]
MTHSRLPHLDVPFARKPCRCAPLRSAPHDRSVESSCPGRRCFRTIWSGSRHTQTHTRMAGTSPAMWQFVWRLLAKAAANSRRLTRPSRTSS